MTCCPSLFSTISELSCKMTYSEMLRSSKADRLNTVRTAATSALWSAVTPENLCQLAWMLSADMLKLKNLKDLRVAWNTL